MEGSSWTWWEWISLIQELTSSPASKSGVMRKNTTDAALVAIAARVGSVGWKCRSKTANGSGCLWRRVLCYLLGSCISCLFR